ncbi:RNA polymerase sigma factor [Chelatococcus asaccharovorans]|uniref:RNA polymerase sigma factor n=1 Tax=Chelatococcus asaccharovorans TaxID=28210 RepID=UPI00224C6A58|nr:sigma-70 family RNA polymerase sigma factor [Chelatococcus asaccharovorans]CAH1651854.1 RNA polymerase sigma factor [Chelatococcus asaccharovorans]CAH1686505.1 RNA polymerase sigma factor [Chelatococcus asaccharovorans]
MKAAPAPGQDRARGSDEDDRLLARIAAGEQAALVRFMERHGRGLRHFAARYLDSREDAEDVVQDVFVAVWKHAGRFDSGRARATTWLYRIAANRCKDLRRWRRLRAFIGLEDLHDLLPADEIDAEAATGARQELARVRAGLRQLPERQRMALLLRAVADLDVPTIAEVMGATVGSVEQLLVRARRALRDRAADADDNKKAMERTSS